MERREAGADEEGSGSFTVEVNMDRRSFLRTMVGGLAAGAAVRTWPFRVYSFPTDLGRPVDMFEYMHWGFSHNLNNPRHQIYISNIQDPLVWPGHELDKAIIECMKSGTGIAIISKPVRRPIQLT
jgi:hypothetical protein